MKKVFKITIEPNLDKKDPAFTMVDFFATEDIVKQMFIADCFICKTTDAKTEEVFTVREKVLNGLKIE